MIMVRIANNLAAEVCRVILLTSNRDLRAMFDKKDARIFHKVANRIEKAHKWKPFKHGGNHEKTKQ